MVAEPPGQLVHHLLEDDGVYVEPEHVEEEPVPHLGLLDDDVDALLLDEAAADVEQIGLNSRVRGETVAAMVTGMKGKDRELDGNHGVDMVDNYQEHRSLVFQPMMNEKFDEKYDENYDESYNEKWDENYIDYYYKK